MCHVGVMHRIGFREVQTLEVLFFALYVIISVLHIYARIFVIDIYRHFANYALVPKYDTMSSNAAAWRWWADWSYNHTQSTAPTTHYVLAVPVQSSKFARH